MSTEERHVASPAYALAQLSHAVAHGNSRKRAQWGSVLRGIASGGLTVGSRAPVADTPTWVTLEVAHGGFATGRFAAEGELRPHEREMLASLHSSTPGSTDRARLNNHFLGDAGLSELRQALKTGAYAISEPEEAALLCFVWLLDHGFVEEAMQLLTHLRPWMARLRFYPRLTLTPAATESTHVHVATVAEVRSRLGAIRANPRVVRMNTTLAIWNPLYDSLAALWLATVDGPAPRFDDASQRSVSGAMPGTVWPEDWAAARAAWIQAYEQAIAQHGATGRHHRPSTPFQHLREALDADPATLSESMRSRVRYALACYAKKHARADRAELRAAQAELAARPLHRDIARVVATRLRAFSADGGLASLDSVQSAVSHAEANATVPEGTLVPPSVQAKAERALVAPLAELVERGIVSSAEVLARVLPQITSRIAAEGIADPSCRTLFARTYAAFRRRRSLLLLNLEHQVQLDELPWVAALAPIRTESLGTAQLAHATLCELVQLTFEHFPHTIIPNPLLREFRTLAQRAGLELPLVEEIAADIFMGTFSAKFTTAADVAIGLVGNTLYGRYYDLPAGGIPVAHTTRWGVRTNTGFDSLCDGRANEAGTGRGVARNGTVLEQSQILTTYNLAVLVSALDLQSHLSMHGRRHAERAFAWACDRIATLPPPKDRLPRLRAVKNAAYAWRQAIFFLSFAGPEQQDEVAQGLLGTAPDRLHPAVRGFRSVVRGAQFDANGTLPNGRRLLGWDCGDHWLLAQ